MQSVVRLQNDRTSFPMSFAGSLVATGLAVCFLCQGPLRSNSWVGAAAITLIYVSMAAVVHGLAIVALRGVFREHIHVNLSRLLWAIWIPVAWLPLLGILTVESSAWVLAVMPMLGLAATVLLTQERVTVEDSNADHTPAELFAPLDTTPLLSMLAPALATAFFLHAGVAAAGAGSTWLAGLLLTLSCIVPAWRALAHTRNLARPWTAAITSGMVLLCTWIALLPVFFVTHAGFALSSHNHNGSAMGPRLGSTAAGYSGIILLPPAPKHQTHIEIPASLIHSAGIPKQPDVIPFDGQYWYFQDPDDRPRPDAHVVRGDPTKARIHSTDRLRLLMEAHQTLSTPIALQDSSVLKVRMVNAETERGTIAVEILLKDPSERWPTSLGVLVLQSSTAPTIDAKRAPVAETLNFKIPDRLKQKRFDEITVRIRPDVLHEVKGSAVSVQSFTLER
ncbi:MAG TPA: hypothetical protein VGN16_08080 [Acidobacteriaceae bacterium]